MRALQLNMRLSEEEHARLKRLAEHYGLSAGEVVRMLVKREHDAVQASSLQSPTGPRPR